LLEQLRKVKPPRDLKFEEGETLISMLATVRRPYQLLAWVLRLRCADRLCCMHRGIPVTFSEAFEILTGVAIRASRCVVFRTDLDGDAHDWRTDGECWLRAGRRHGAPRTVLEAA
jgi:hypothetical protein